MIALAKLFTWSKTIHRQSMWGMIILGLTMGITGSMLKYPIASSSIPGVSLRLVRYLHNQVSPFFGLLLFVMMVTGIYMYWFPWYTKRQALKKSQNLS